MRNMVNFNCCKKVKIWYNEGDSSYFARLEALLAYYRVKQKN